MTILESYMLGDAPTTQIVFQDKRINEVEKLDQRDLLMILNKPTLILHIDFVILDEFKNMKIKTFL